MFSFRKNSTKRLFESFHFKSKNTGITPKGYVDKPEWNIIEHKFYEGVPSIKLPTPEKISNSLSDLLFERASGRKFQSTITIENLSSVLYWSLGIKDTQKKPEQRMYPSAGRRFPLEAYILIFEAIGDITIGIYHYSTSNHTLSLLKENCFDEETLRSLTMYKKHIKAKVMIVLTAVFERTVMKYGDRGYRFILLEAGCVTHTVTLAATAYGIDSVHMGGAVDPVIEKLLDIDGMTEGYIHSVFLG